MDITPLVPADRPLLKGYGDGGFSVRGTRFEGSILILPHRVVPWSITSMADFSLESLAPVFECEPLPEFLLIGCGPEMVIIAPRLRADIRSAGLVLEAMDTGAACRTWNVLLTEGRNAAAALLAV